MISSRHNPRVKRALKLRGRKGRAQQNRLLIDGTRELQRAIAAGVAIDEVFVCERLCAGPRARQVIAELPQTGAAVWQVTPDVFARLAFGDRHEGLLAVARTPHRKLAEIELPPEPLVAVLEGVEKPGNLGAILRSADAAGVAAVVVADGRTDLFNPAAIRASLGTVFHVPICTASAAETLDWLDRHELDIFAAQPASGRLYTDVDLRKGVAVVFGTEATGLSPVWTEPACQGIRLPQRGIADSLNVAVAAAVVFYEALRQRSA
jgi:TrmH family RNA methyltransferase